MTRTITLVEQGGWADDRSLWTAKAHPQGHGSVEAGYFDTPEAALEWALKQK